MRPLNGNKTHPLTPHAIFCLQCLAEKPRPCQEINPGVVNRLRREDLAEIFQAPSPFKSSSGKSIEWLRITAADQTALAARSQP